MRRTMIAATALALLGGACVASGSASATAPKETHFFYAIVADSSPPTAGSEEDFNAVLQSANTPVAGVTVVLLVKPYGSTSYVPAATGTTDANGMVDVSARLNRTSGIKWSFAGDATYAASETDGYVQNVAARVRVKAQDLTLARGQRLVVNGATFPVKAGRKVYLMRGSIPYPLTVTPAPTVLSHGRVAADGTLRLTKRFFKKGVKHLFVMVAGGAGNATGYSRYLRIHVR